MLAAASSPDIVFLFAGAGLVLYVASRAAVDAITPTSDPSPGRMAAAQWMPIAWAALLATAAGHSEVGITLALATSVAVMALNLGVLLLLSPPHRHDPAAAPPTLGIQDTSVYGGRAWPFVLAGALLAFLAGFTGFLNLLHAIMMLLLGGCVWTVWHIKPVNHHADRPAAHRLRAMQLLLAIALGGVGAWLGYQAVIAADARTRVATAGLLSAAVFSPLLVLPVLGSGAIAANNGRLNAVVADIVAVVLLNICGLLPLVVLTDYARQIILAWRAGTHEALPILDLLKPVPFPLSVWRLDTVLLMVLGLLLIPVSLNRWTLKKAEGFCLTAAYIAYLVISAALTVRL